MSGIYHPSPTSPSSSTTRIRIQQYEPVKPVNHEGVTGINERALCISLTEDNQSPRTMGRTLKVLRNYETTYTTPDCFGACPKLPDFWCKRLFHLSASVGAPKQSLSKRLSKTNGPRVSMSVLCEIPHLFTFTEVRNIRRQVSGRILFCFLDDLMGF